MYICVKLLKTVLSNFIKEKSLLILRKWLQLFLIIGLYLLYQRSYPLDHHLAKTMKWLHVLLFKINDWHLLITDFICSLFFFSHIKKKTFRNYLRKLYVRFPYCSIWTKGCQIKKYSFSFSENKNKLEHYEEKFFVVDLFEISYCLLQTSLNKD